MIRQYEKYKDSGVEWIGEIPEGWEVKRLSRISYMKGRIGWQGLKQAEFTSNPDDPYLITGMNFKDGVIDWPEVYHITEERYQEAPDIQLKDNDVLITKDGTIGKLLFVDKIPYPHKASLNSHLLVLRPLNHEYYSKYLFYQLQSIIFKHHVELTKTGTTFFGITQEAMGQFRALLPPTPEQTAIATFLDRKTAEIDQLISNKEKLIALYEEEKTAIINRAVTRGLDPKVKTKPSGVEWLGHIPGHWAVKRLKRLASKITDGEHISPTFTLEGMPFLSAKDVREDQVIFSNDKFVSPADGERFRKRCNPEKNDLLLVSRGATIGRVAIVDTDIEFCLLGSVILIKPTEHIVPAYLLYSLKNKLLQDNFLLTSQSSAQQAIYLVSVVDIAIACPEKAEQTAIVAHIETECSRLDAIIEKFKKQIELFKEYRTTLISEVVTGKIDVRDEVAA